ncbi:MAG: divalent-cation tolerance protein CutA [Candidatus Omnitrophica bacterium]|nr:divalent-cation tolerance protein CutA [Candidatus Omnitrophota bacterium]
MDNICVLYVTAPGKEAAMEIAKSMVSLRLAACANVIDGVTSFYRWEGKETEDKETVMLLKTTEKLVPELEKAIKKMHSYSCPCIIAFPVIHASKEYADWIRSQTR